MRNRRSFTKKSVVSTVDFNKSIDAKITNENSIKLMPNTNLK